MALERAVALERAAALGRAALERAAAPLERAAALARAERAVLARAAALWRAPWKQSRAAQGGSFSRGAWQPPALRGLFSCAPCARGRARGTARVVGEKVQTMSRRCSR